MDSSRKLQIVIAGDQQSKYYKVVTKFFDGSPANSKEQLAKNSQQQYLVLEKNFQLQMQRDSDI